LEKEGFPFPVSSRLKQKIINVGDVMYDAVKFYIDKAIAEVELSDLSIENTEYVLATIHRAENTEDISRVTSIFEALQQISNQIQVVIPLHPRTRSKLSKLGLERLLLGLKTLKPVSYLEMQRLEMGASVILTDSGGVQKEAYFHKIPCITLRDDTEWIETVESGWNVLVGANKSLILNAFRNIHGQKVDYEHYYGDGDSSNEIVKCLMDYN
jgi:UDP-N-acetylglucosamine 2-epimerase